MENEDVVGAVPTGDASTTSEWITIQLPTKVRLILEMWRYVQVISDTEVNLVVPEVILQKIKTYLQVCISYNFYILKCHRFRKAFPRKTIKYKINTMAAMAWLHKLPGHQQPWYWPSYSVWISSQNVISSPVTDTDYKYEIKRKSHGTSRSLRKNFLARTEGSA